MAPAAWAEPDAAVARVKGGVLVQADAEGSFDYVQAGAPVLYGDSVRTRRDSAAHIVFANGDVILLKADSKLKISGSAGAVSLSLTQGECLIAVKRTLGPGETFTAATPDASASFDRGLAWIAASGDKGSTFLSFSGSLSVTAHRKTVVLEPALEPGAAIHVASGQAPEQPQPAGQPQARLDSFALDGSIEGVDDLLASAPATAKPSAAPEPAPPAPEKARPPVLRIELHPRYKFAQTYDDNIFLVPSDKPGPVTVGGGVRGSWISQNELGLDFTAPLTAKHKINGTADFTAQNYAVLARANNAYDNAEKAGYTYTGKGAVFNLTNAYENTMIPAFSELVARQRHWMDTTGLKLEVIPSRSLYCQLDASDMITKYLDPTLASLLNHYEQSAGGRLGLLLAPKTKVFVAYHRGVIHYSTFRNAGSKSHSADAGVEGELTRKLKGLVQFGWQSRYYDGSTTPILNRVQRAWESNVALNYAATRSLLVKLSGFRNFTESTFANNRYYTAEGADFNARYALRRLGLGANGSFEIDRYPEAAAAAGGITANRRDDLYGFGVNADYKVLEWLKAGLSFSRLNRFSIFSGQFNYADDRTALELTAAF